jgi:tetratricopeptide (TPR) repeat protein
MSSSTTTTDEDASFDALFAGLKRWSESEREEYCDALEDHPLFLGSTPTISQLENNSTLSALSTIQYDEIDTPQSLAEQAKDDGNAAFRRGVAFYGQALKHYRDAIDHAVIAEKDELKIKKKKEIEKSRARPVIAACYSNLAAIHLARKKYITALGCCESALKADPKHPKALYRAAKCCLELGRANAAVAFCHAGSAVVKNEDDEKAFASLLLTANAMVTRQEGNRAIVRANRERRFNEIINTRAEVVKRNIRMGPPIFRPLAAHLAGPAFDPLPKPSTDHEGILDWPVLLLYPEHSTADFVVACPEVATMSDLLASVLPSIPPPRGSIARPNERAAWDIRGQYWVGGVDVYYCESDAPPLTEPWADEAIAVAPLEDDFAIDAAGQKEEAKKKEKGNNYGVSADFISKASAALYKALPRGALVKVPHHAPLLLALVQPKHLIADLPTFLVLPRGSEVTLEFQKRSGGIFKEIHVPDFDKMNT